MRQTVRFIALRIRISTLPNFMLASVNEECLLGTEAALFDSGANLLPQLGGWVLNQSPEPIHEFAYFELGRALLQLGDVARAIENLETAKKLSPDHDATYYQLSQAYRRAGRVQEAEETLATYRKLIEGSRLKKRESLETEKP